MSLAGEVLLVVALLIIARNLNRIAIPLVYLATVVRQDRRSNKKEA